LQQYPHIDALRSRLESKKIHMPLNFTLATRNLFHDRVRFVATAVGIVFSVVLVTIQVGLYLGFGRMVTSMIDHASTDLWVVRKGTKCFEDPSLIGSGLRDQIVRHKGIANVTPLLIGFSGWIVPTGEITPVFVVGANLQNSPIEPWNVTEGKVQDLKSPDAVAVDSTYFDRLGVSGIGSHASIRGQPTRVVAVTTGIRSFTTTPYIFTDMERARRYIGVPDGVISYFLLKLEPGADVAKVRQDLTRDVAHIEVLTSDEFRDRSRAYWLFGTGAGAALFAGSILGIIVGVVIVAQTLYSSTKDHWDEFATLRAIGSSKKYIYNVILYQAILNAVIGFCLASAVVMIVVSVASNGTLPVLITPGLMAAMLALTVVMCVVSALAAIARVVRIDPVTVFTR
jgi:putative ABC transport system permease protein